MAFVNAEQEQAARAIGAALAELGLEAERPQPGSFLVRLAGQRKLATMTWLIAGAHSPHVEAFFCRQPDENHASFYRFLLERNGRIYGVHFAVDDVGDVYLVGRLPLAAVSTPEIDRVLAPCSPTPTRTSTGRWRSGSRRPSGGNGRGASSAARA
jgi:putative sensory transduction regulator